MFIPVGGEDGQAIYVVDKDKNGKITKKKAMDVWVQSRLAFFRVEVLSLSWLHCLCSHILTLSVSLLYDLR